MYSKSYIENFFLNLTLNTQINPKHELSWGFYFKNDDIKALKKAKKILLAQGYNFAEIVEENKEFYLHIEKIEIHNINSLYKRCVELTALTKKLDINCFDGFDVEKQQ